MNPIIPALAGGFLALAAIPALTGELGAVLGAGHSYSTRLEAMEQGRPRVGLSTDSHKRVLDICIDTLTDLRIIDTTHSMRQAVLSHCNVQVARALALSPTDGFVWWASAALAAEQGDVPGVFEGLAQSRQTAPGELWIALRRADLDARLEPLQSAEQRAGQDADLLVLAQSRRGVERLVLRYISDPDFRERVVALVEQLPPRDQRRFLGNVRTLSGGVIQ